MNGEPIPGVLPDTLDEFPATLSADAVKAIKPIKADFWRCYSCGRVATNLEMEAALGPDGDGYPCPCGSRRFQPSNFPWYGWFLPRIWKFFFLRIAGKA